jgi:hypothetical protein
MCESSVLCLQSALRLAPRDAKAWDLMALLLPADLLTMKQHCWAQALSCGAASSDSWGHASLFYLKHGMRELAKKSFEALQILDPTRSVVWVAQGYFNRDVHQAVAYESARAAFVRARELQPGSVGGLQGLAEMSFVVGQMTDAVFYCSLLVRALPLHPLAHAVRSSSICMVGTSQLVVSMGDNSCNFVAFLVAVPCGHSMLSELIMVCLWMCMWFTVVWIGS